MGFFDDVGKSISNTVKSVGNTVSNVAKDVGSVWDTNRENFERSDIGNVVRVAVEPITAPIDASRHLVSGDFQGAAGRIGGSLLNNNPVSQTINSSSSVKDFMQSDTVNNLTAGWSNDAVLATDSYNNLTNGRLTDTDIANMVRYGARSATYAVAGGYALNNGYVAQATDWAKNNVVEAFAIGNLAAQGKYDQIAAGVADKFIPGVGNIIGNPPGSRPTPVDSGFSDTGPGAAIDSYTVSGLDTKTMLALAAAFFVVVALFFKRRR